MSDITDPDRLRRLERAVRRLPRREREIFLAHRLEDMSYEEIALQTGLAVDEVERRMASAMYRLLRELDAPRPRWWERWF